MTATFMNHNTKRWLDAFIRRPTAAVLLDCMEDQPYGLQVAGALHDRLIGSKGQPLFVLDSEGKKSIGIESIRELRNKLAMRADRTDGAISRIFVIPDAGKLTSEAQNALLKIMEELPQRTVLCMLADHKDQLLPTIVSRCFIIPILPAAEEDVTNSYPTLDPRFIQKCIALSEGKPSLLQRLLQEENAEIYADIELAKKFMGAPVYDRQSIVQQLTSKDGDVNGFMRAMRLSAKTAMRHSRNPGGKAKWQRTLKTILETEELLRSNVSPKLALLHLSVCL